MTVARGQDRADDVGDPNGCTVGDTADGVAGTTAGFEDMVAALRDVQNSVAASDVAESIQREVAQLLRQAVALLNDAAASTSAESEGDAGSAPGSAVAEVPGMRNHGLAPTYVVESLTDTQLRATVRFSFFYNGFGAVHGGVLPLLFDDVIGRLVNSMPGFLARTANLAVDFRKITPVDTDLTVTASLVRREGRKLWMAGTLTDADDMVLAEATGLWIILRDSISS